MAPNTTSIPFPSLPLGGLAKCSPEDVPPLLEKVKVEEVKTVPVRQNIKWANTIAIIGIHSFMGYVILTQEYNVMRHTVLWCFALGGIGGFGVTAGAHRLWTHRAYKAKWPLRALLLACYSIAGQNTIYEWVRDHRVHHKFSETDADPHNSNRGFFFAHVGWLMMDKHPEVLRKGRTVDLSDIKEDPLVTVHDKFFIPIKVMMCFVLPILIPFYAWEETLYNSVVSTAVVRYVLSLNFTWLVNSAAHMWGNRPYDNRINPVESRAVALVAMGEGWHNYHHVFPWDYKAAELGNYGFNITTFWIDLFARIGWAYDLKSPSPELVRSIAERNGDGTHPVWGHHVQEVPEEEDPNIQIKYPSKQKSSYVNGDAKHIFSSKIVQSKDLVDTCLKKAD